MADSGDKKSVTPIEKFGKTFMVVTGASRGLGAEICKGFSPILGENSLILGLARNKEGLQRTKDAVEKINPKIQFSFSQVDLETSSKEATEILQKFADSANREFDRCIIVHNAGSLGKLDYLKNENCLKDVQNYFNFNINSMVILNTQFLALCEKMKNKPKVNVVNISSICSTLPIKSWGLYCTGKAARHMFFKVLALEEKDIDILNYSPGPLKGDMQDLVREKTADAETKEMFVKMHQENKLIDMKVSVGKLVYLMKSGKYSSGDSVDYYDEI